MHQVSLHPDRQPRLAGHCRSTLVNQPGHTQRTILGYLLPMMTTARCSEIGELALRLACTIKFVAVRCSMAGYGHLHEDMLVALIEFADDREQRCRQITSELVLCSSRVAFACC
mmetsp:Transcript_19063/g.31921  ORF Transcript_19063/g.31921 Transcript_19063/m.31921 type:complete len:114 (-) Transcript_19063:412-753(-)